MKYRVYVKTKSGGESLEFPPFETNYIGRARQEARLLTARALKTLKRHFDCVCIEKQLCNGIKTVVV